MQGDGLAMVEREFVQKQIDSYSRSLRILQEQRNLYFSSVDIPIQLEMDIRTINARLTELERDLELSKSSRTNFNRY